MKKLLIVLTLFASNSGFSNETMGKEIELKSCEVKRVFVSIDYSEVVLNEIPTEGLEVLIRKGYDIKGADSGLIMGQATSLTNQFMDDGIDLSVRLQKDEKNQGYVTSHLLKEYQDYSAPARLEDTFTKVELESNKINSAIVNAFKRFPECIEK